MERIGCLSIQLCVAALLMCAFGSAYAYEDGSSLFVELDLNEIITAVVDPEHADMQAELVGIIIDGKESETVLVYRLNEKFFLPTIILGKMGVRGSAEGGRFFLVTPGGNVEIDSNVFRIIKGRTYFIDDLLDEILKVRWEFLADKYALNLTLPWWRQREGIQVGGEPDQRETDFKPSSFGLTQVRLDHVRYSDDYISYSFNEMLLRGRLAEGTWRAEIIAEENRDVRAEGYYWLRDFNSVQALVGNQQVLINPLLPGLETTGVQALYNSKSLEFNPYQDQTRSQYIRRLGIPVREIEGIARPGAIAELRINDRPAARVRVRLDGTYRFSQIQLPSAQFVTVQVHILDQRSFMTLEVQDFTQTPSELLLDAGQTVAFAGIGVQGNPLDPGRDVGDEAFFGLWRYGLSERVTLEAGAQTANGILHEVVGVTASLWKQWATSISLAQNSGNLGYTTDLVGRGQRWQMNLRSQKYQDGFRSAGSTKSSFQDLRFQYWLSPNIAIGAYGRSVHSGQFDKNFLLPGVTWRFNSRNSLRAWPDANGDYRTDLRTYHRERDWFEFVHDSSGVRAEYRFYQNEKLEYFARLENHNYFNTTTAEIGAIWYPREFDDRSSLHASVLVNDSEFGYRFTWQTSLLPGIYSHLEVRDEPVRTQFSDPGLQLRWTLSLDFAIAGGRPIPARNEFSHSRTGSIGGKLALGNGKGVKSEGIDRVSVMINGTPHIALVNGSHFFVKNLLPGTYQVSLSSEYLPMNLSPEKNSYRVRVASSATTNVNFTLRYEYGISGQITSQHQQPVAGVTIKVYGSDNKLIASARTDQYGYYRLSGLVPGSYSLRIFQDSLDVAERQITIEDAHIFDVDFTGLFVSS